MRKPVGDREQGKKSPTVDIEGENGDEIAPPPPEVLEPDRELSPEEAEQARKDYLLTRFWISARASGAATATASPGRSRSASSR